MASPNDLWREERLLGNFFSLQSKHRIIGNSGESRGGGVDENGGDNDSLGGEEVRS